MLANNNHPDTERWYYPVLLLSIFSLMLIGTLLVVPAIPALLPTFLYESIRFQAELMGLPLIGETKAYWYMARISGFVAYFLFWASTVWGLLLSTKIVKSWLSPIFSFGLHEILSLLGLGFSLFHAFILLGDRYIQFTVAAILIPFAAPYEPFWTGLGQLAIYLNAIIIGSFYVRKWIGQRVWRWLHYTTLAGFVAILAHGLMAGTDSNPLISIVIYFVPASVVLFLLIYRILGPNK